MNTSHVLLLGGGTGGHIYPLVAVAASLREAVATVGNSLDLRYYGEPGVYTEYLQAAGIPITSVATSKLRRYASALTIVDFFKFFLGFFQALVRLYFFMPDVVFSKGGPGVLPIIFAARWYRIPIVIHESDAVPGLTSRVSSRRAKTVEIAFEAARPYFGAHKQIHLTGMPVRAALLGDLTPAAARAEIGITSTKPVIFVIGGSQGAGVLNEFVMTHAESLLTHYTLVHQVGRDNYEQYAKEFAFTTKHYNQELTKSYFLFSYLTDAQLAAALRGADVVISRAGSSIFEIAASGTPAILVPLASSANNHQVENAYAYAAAGAGVVIEEGNLLPGVVGTQIEKMLNDSTHREAMIKAARVFYKPNAATEIAHDILTVAGTA